MSFTCFKLVYKIMNNLDRHLYEKYLEKYESDDRIIYIDERLKDEVLGEADEDDKDGLKYWFNNIDMGEDYLFG